MSKRVEVDRLQGEGEVRLADGSVVPCSYDVRVYDVRQRIETNQGVEWRSVGFGSYGPKLQHGGKLRPPQDSSSIFLVMSDGRQLELIPKRSTLEHGITEVVATGGILPANEDS